jgi:hypothetical protein
MFDWPTTKTSLRGTTYYSSNWMPFKVMTTTIISYSGDCQTVRRGASRRCGKFQNVISCNLCILYYWMANKLLGHIVGKLFWPNYLIKGSVRCLFWPKGAVKIAEPVRASWTEFWEPLSQANRKFNTSSTKDIPPPDITSTNNFFPDFCVSQEEAGCIFVTWIHVNTIAIRSELLWKR